MLAKTPLSTVKRAPSRASYEREDLYPIIDALKMAHISFIQGDQPVTIPMLCWRVEDRLYVHGSRGSRLMKQLAEGCPVCVTFAKLDGWVMAKSAFHHSANYRSAVLFGRFEPVEETTAQLEFYKDFIEQLEVGRWDQIRQPNSKELAATSLLAMRIDEGSVKTRTGGPNDDADDLSLPVWAGVLDV